MQQLSETSLTMKTALEGGGEGFDALGEKAAAARGGRPSWRSCIRDQTSSDTLAPTMARNMSHWVSQMSPWVAR